jgi:hypothetical protein
MGENIDETIKAKESGLRLEILSKASLTPAKNRFFKDSAVALSALFSPWVVLTTVDLLCP